MYTGNVISLAGIPRVRPFFCVGNAGVLMHSHAKLCPLGNRSLDSHVVSGASVHAVLWDNGFIHLFRRL